MLKGHLTKCGISCGKACEACEGRRQLQVRLIQCHQSPGPSPGRRNRQHPENVFPARHLQPLQTVHHLLGLPLHRRLWLCRLPENNGQKRFTLTNKIENKFRLDNQGSGSSDSQQSFKPPRSHVGCHPTKQYCRCGQRWGVSFLLCSRLLRTHKQFWFVPSIIKSVSVMPFIF